MNHILVASSASSPSIPIKGSHFASQVDTHSLDPIKTRYYTKLEYTSEMYLKCIQAVMTLQFTFIIKLTVQQKDPNKRCLIITWKAIAFQEVFNFKQKSRSNFETVVELTYMYCVSTKECLCK